MGPRPPPLTETEKRKIDEREARAKQAEIELLKTPRDFKDAMWRRFGNLVRAWRLGFSSDTAMNLSKLDFVAAADRLDYVGEADALWKAFAGSDQSRFVSLHAMAPYMVEELLLFKRSLESVRRAEAPKIEKKEAS